MIWEIPELDTYFANKLTPEGWEIDHLNEALKYCTKFRTAIDGGAHIGTWSVNLDKMFDMVMAFEPSKDTFMALLKNVHRYAPEVACFNAALGERSSVCNMVDDPTRLGNTGARIAVHLEGTIPVHTIDQYWLEDLDFLKLDVEGQETLALKGALQTIERCKPTIVVELKEFSPPRNGGVAATRLLLDSIGYREVGGLRNDKVFVSK